MNASAVKLAPTGVILAAAVASAWPYFGGFQETTPPAASPAGGGPEVPAALLKPATLPRPAHDPFQDPEVSRGEARARVSRFLSSLIKPKTDPKKSPKGAAKGGTKTGLPNPAGEGTPDLDPREGLILSATSAHGLRGAAVINGHTYLTGETVRDAKTPEPCVLHEVRPNLALLRHRDRTYPLAYPTHAARATPALTGATGPTADQDETTEAPGTRRVPARGTGARKRITPKQ